MLGYKLYVTDEMSIDSDEEDGADDFDMCKTFLEITKNLVEKKGVSPLQIPKLFNSFGKKAIDLLYPSKPGSSITILNKTCVGVDEPGLFHGHNLIIKPSKPLKPKPSSKNGSYMIKDFILDMLNDMNYDKMTRAMRYMYTVRYEQ